MASAANHHYRNPVLDRLPQKRLSPTVMGGVSIAILIHAGLAAYIIHERFQISVPEEVEAPPFTGAILNMEKPKPKPEPTPQKEVRQTPVVVHAPADPVISEVAPLEVTPTPHADAQPGTGPVVVLDGAPGNSPTIVEAPAGPVYVKAIWSKFPDAAAMMQYYPVRAMDAETDGSATLACTVTDTKGRVRCDILAEMPRGYGFGDAAVRAVEAKGRADTSAGAVQVGAVMKVRMGFTME
ncbi:hypothetical protein PQU92_11370 [Asticcacaulis sp. BYS171W]|uniref:Energy transducer TonB n=1 Tax=Asticcacaulis aquaticus TaxID=2984212 RepID=A0ABT5HV08_9CAUL|nr:hypothetical protein [Asticcacaulis aquaticus]MDC7683879.1 hypothetical protein [Asticcacaulis aquaticus]